jgi:aldehyde:ferredoxin oxidoreductase
MDFGYMGQILRVDLASGAWESDSLDSDARRKFLGGRGLGIYMLSRETVPETDPYGEENPLIFMTGPYTGTGVFSAFYNVTTVSPLTGLPAASHSGGTWGPSLKRAGYDAAIVRGKAVKPCYLLIKDGSCRIMDAGDLWGRGVKETQALLQDRHGKVSVAAIGPAGENLVRNAAIMNDIHRAAGRGGVGAVMGSKNLKAVVVGGTRKIQYHNRDAFVEISREGGKKARNNAKAFASYGTSMAFALFNERGTLPTYNFRGGHFEAADEINGDALKTRYFVRDHGCFNCPLKCANIHTVPEGPYQVQETEGPEYETLMAFGPNCGNANLASIIKANDLCNDLGIDTIAMGNAVALMFDLHDRGLLDDRASAGLDLSWGNADAMVRLVQMTAYKEGLGEVLAEGTVGAARHFGKECEKYVMHAKNQDFPGYEVRRTHGTGLSFATSTRGACHLRASMYVDELFSGELDPYGLGDDKIEVLVNKENFLTLVDSLSMCKFGQRNGEFTPDVPCGALTHLTGMEFSADELLRIGERIYNLERHFRPAGMKVPDMLPDRLFEEGLDDSMAGGERLSREEFDKALQAYYRRRGWDEKGQPTPAKLAELDLS